MTCLYLTFATLKTKEIPFANIVDPDETDHLVKIYSVCHSVRDF